MRIVFLLIIISLAFNSCDEKSATTASTVVENEPAVLSVEQAAPTSKTVDYVYESIMGSETKIAKLLDENGRIKESGMMLNGHKTGVWTYNYPDTDYPAKLISFVNDIQNGPYFELNDRGQTTVMAYYKNNKLHGPWAKFRFGKAEMSVNYVEGERHGLYRELDFKNGKVKKEVDFKNGKENGLMRYFDPEGNVTVEYEYKDGVKINGGIVD